MISIIERLLEKPYWIVDILPEQVPEDSAGQYFMIEEYYLKGPQASVLRRKLANIILKINCYYDLNVIKDFETESSKHNPKPEELDHLFVGKNAADHIDILVEGENTLVVSNRDDLYLTVYNPSLKLLNRIRLFAQAEGMFVWQPQRD